MLTHCLHSHVLYGVRSPATYYTAQFTSTVY